MGQIWKVIAEGARWLWKNSWWIVPAGETIYNQVKSWLKRKKIDPESKNPNT